MRMKKAFALALVILILPLKSSYSEAAYQTPDTIRVGLYYTDPSVSVNTALSSFTVNADMGIQAGFFVNDAFTAIYEESTSASLTIRKDSYDYGSYHIKAGTDFPDKSTAVSQALLLKQQGLSAYPVYVDVWQVWIGAYTDEASASQDAVSVSALPGVGKCAIVAPAGNRIVVCNAQNQLLCIFGSDTAYFRIMPNPENNPNVLSIKGKKYRGALEVRRLAASDMTVINVLKINEYLYGNVPPEIGGKSPAEALKAQALASKMYAINNRGKHKKTGFDICATTSCQVYKGYSSEVVTCNAAIDEVCGKVITYNGSLAGQIYYFASSGGRTEDAANVWGYPYPYLISVNDNYDPVISWTKTIRASDIKARITGIGNILGMTITKTSLSGRVTQLAVRGDQRTDTKVYKLEGCRTFLSLDSQLYTIKTDADVYVSYNSSTALKTQLGGKTAVTASGTKNLISSNNMISVIGASGVKSSIALVPETYTFTGKGWGHAVGLSQDGAIGMGKAGIKYDEILMHYFPGTKIE